jgi:hypothetical protein
MRITTMIFAALALAVAAPAVSYAQTAKPAAGVQQRSRAGRAFRHRQRVMRRARMYRRHRLRSRRFVRQRRFRGI